MRFAVASVLLLTVGAVRSGAEPPEVSVSSKGVTELSPIKFYESAKSGFKDLKVATAMDVAKWLKDRSAVLLDLRSKTAFDRAHLRGATSLPATELTDEALAKAVPSKESRVVVYCDDNIMPTRRIALTTLGTPAIAQLGYRNLYQLEKLWMSKDCRRDPAKPVDAENWCPSTLPLERPPK